MTDTQAPDYKGFTKAIMEGWAEHGDADAFTKFELAIRHNILREIPGGYNPDQHDDVTGSCPEAGDQWYEMNDAPDLSAAREAAAAQAMREAAAKEIDCEGCGGKCYDPANCWQSAAADIRALPVPDTTALDRLIAERVREAVEAEREACRQIVQSVINDPRTKFWGDLAEARARIVARGSKEGRDA